MPNDYSGPGDHVKDVPSGLTNGGNTCFLAAATQILITIPSVRRLALAWIFICTSTKVQIELINMGVLLLLFSVYAYI